MREISLTGAEIPPITLSAPAGHQRPAHCSTNIHSQIDTHLLVTYTMLLMALFLLPFFMSSIFITAGIISICFMYIFIYLTSLLCFNETRHIFTRVMALFIHCTLRNLILLARHCIGTCFIYLFLLCLHFHISLVIMKKENVKYIHI